MVPVSYYVALAAILFTMGALGVLIRRNAIVIFMSIELMLNAANLAFVAFAQGYDAINGQIFVFFVITVAAAEVAVGLALIATGIIYFVLAGRFVLPATKSESTTTGATAPPKATKLTSAWTATGVASSSAPLAAASFTRWLRKG